MNDEKLKVLLERSGEFQAEVHEFASGLIPADGKRYLVALQASLLSLEHAAGALVLISQGFYPSAIALMRPQYESLVRGIWLLHTANDTWVAKLSEPLTVDSAKRANEGLMLAEMLKELEKSNTAPAAIVEQGMSEFLCSRRSETCPRRRASLATNDRRGGQVGAHSTQRFW